MDSKLKAENLSSDRLSDPVTGEADCSVDTLKMNDLTQRAENLKKTGSQKGDVKILIVDDLKENLFALEGILKRDDVEIFKAKSGIEALEFMINHRFAVALIDVQMPGMSGFELAEFMRGTKKTRDIPIIFLTATATDQSFVFRGYESGAVDFLLKPLDTHAVKGKVNIFIEIYQQKKDLKDQLEIITGLLEALKLSRSEAERANAAKSQFLANMSHELRTPLNAILGYSELLTSPDKTNADALYFSNGIQRNIGHLTELIDGVLDISKIEAGKLEVERVQFLLLPELSEIFSSVNDLAKARGLAFDVFFDGEIPKSILACPIRLRQILSNVLGNALKFTEKGAVSVVVKLTANELGASRALLNFVVKDTGCGVAPEQQERLFRPFGQADSSVTRKYRGTGLGLALARHLAEALGGNLALTESAIGRGSTFTASLDPGPLEGEPMLEGLTKADLKAHQETPKDLFRVDQRLADLQILLVEDSPDLQLLMRCFLEVNGATVALAVNGAEAVLMAADKAYDLVLMDMQMPVLDGYEATKQLLAKGYATPVVALTANAMRGDLEACLAVGCVEYITKPVKANVLVDTVARFAKKRSHTVQSGD